MDPAAPNPKPNDDTQCEKGETTFWDLLAGFIRQNRKLFGLYLVFVLLVPLQDVGLPHMIGRLISTIKDKGPRLLPQLGIVMAMLFALQFGYTMYDYVDVKMYPALQDYIRSSIVRLLLDRQRVQHSELKMADVTSTLIKLPSATYTVIEILKNYMLPQLVVYLVSILYVGYHVPLLGLLAAAMVATVYWTIFSTMYRCESVSAERDALFNAVQEEVDDLLRNSISVLSYDQEAPEMERVRGLHEVYAKYSEHSLKCALSARYSMSPIIFSFLVVFTFVCHRKVRAGTLTIGVFVSLFIVALQNCMSLWKVVAGVKDIVIRWGIIKHALHLFSTSCEAQDQAQAQAQDQDQDQDQNVRECNHGIFLENVDFAYPGLSDPISKLYDVEGSAQQLRKHGHRSAHSEKIYILRGLTFCIEPRQTTLITGKIGSGKSTLLKLIMLYQRPSGGEVYLHGQPYSAMTPEQLRRRIGYIPQVPILFNRTIYENMTYGIQGATRQKVMALLNELDVFDIIDRLPQGLDTPAGKMGTHLSGGQRQIVWIIRTVLRGFDTIVVDEPTSAMDAYTKGKVQRMLATVFKGKTVVIVTHDEILTKSADRVIEMDHGRIVRDFRPKDMGQKI
jgi:ABC-type multidrug transport system fused ATPase/permease subunit